MGAPPGTPAGGSESSSARRSATTHRHSLTFNSALRHHPRQGLELKRSLVLLMMGRGEDARRGLVQPEAAFYHPGYTNWLVALGGEPKHLARVAKGKAVYGQLARYHSGSIDAAQLIRATASAPAVNRMSIYAQLALVAERRGRPEEARRMWDSCQKLRVRRMWVIQLARQRLGLPPGRD